MPKGTNNYNIMNKIELKHLAPYLPYGLQVKCWRNREGVKPWTETLTRLFYSTSGDITTENSILSANEYKPILKPLSELKNWNTIDSKTIQIQMLELDGDVSLLSYQLFEVLLENHFDVFGLIPLGLAVEEKIK